MRVDGQKDCRCSINSIPNGDLVPHLFVGERPPPVETMPVAGAWRKLFDATDNELSRLFALVRAKYPEHCRTGDVDSFRAALCYVESRGRLAQPDRRYYVSSFCDDAEAYAKSIGAPTKGVAELFFAACIASADTQFTLPSPEWSAAVGLSKHITTRRPTHAWRQVLNGTVAVLMPFLPPQLK